MRGGNRGDSHELGSIIQYDKSDFAERNGGGIRDLDRFYAGRRFQCVREEREAKTFHMSALDL